MVVSRQPLPDAEREVLVAAPYVAPAPAARARRDGAVPATFYQRRGKRVLDVSLGTVLFLGLLPIMVVAAVAVLLGSGWPILYRSRRVGAGGREFWMLKFRTMRRDADAHLESVLVSSREALVEFRGRRKLRKDPRKTLIGSLLRVSSIDELPQLLHVILGQMSLVGPRPVPRDELKEMYGALSGRVYSVRPGITGSWQVNGRSHTTYFDRIRLDCTYATTESFAEDLRILIKTLLAVLRTSEAA